MDCIATLGPFEVDRPVSRGAFGRVWRGRNAATGAAVALKVVDLSATEGFGPELDALTRLQHPKIVAPLEHGLVRRSAADRLQTRTDAPWMAMTWVGGGDLGRVQAELPTVRRWTEDLLEALAHAHAHGVLHLDLKPRNVLLRPSGTATLTDFGIASLIEDHSPKRAGTPGFMSPEQIRARTLTPATDLYGLGCTVWALLMGHPPFGELDGPGRMQAHLATELQPPASLPDPVAHWLRRCLAHAASDRFQTAAEARHALWDAELKHTPTPDAPATHPTMVPATLSLDDFEPEAERSQVVFPPASVTTLPERAPVDPVWTMLTLRARRLCLEGAERSLLDRIQLPLLGREREAGILWSLAQRVVREGRPMGIALTGPEGVGKHHLARWIRTALAEHGATQASTLPRRARELTVVTCDAGHGLAVLLHRARGPVLLVTVGTCPGIPSLAVGPLPREPLVVLGRGLTGVDEGVGNAIADASEGLPGRLLELVRGGPPWPSTSMSGGEPLDALRAQANVDPAEAFEGVWPLLLRPFPAPHRMLAAASVAMHCLEQLGIGLDSDRALLVHARQAHCWALDAQHERIDDLERRLEAMDTTRHQAWLWYVRGLRKHVGSGRVLPRAEARTGLVLARRIGDRLVEAQLLGLLLSSGSAADNHVYQQAVDAQRALTRSEAWTPVLTQIELQRCLRTGALDRARKLGERLLADGAEQHLPTLANLAWKQGDLAAARGYAERSRDHHAATGTLSVLGDYLLLAHLDAIEHTLTVRAIQDLADRIDTCFGGPSAFGTEALALVFEQLFITGELTLARRVQRELSRYDGRRTPETEATLARVRALQQG